MTIQTVSTLDEATITNLSNNLMNHMVNRDS